MTPHPRPYHRAEAERLLDYADEWTAQAGEPDPEASELSCLAWAAVHALLAIHDALTAADRYAANEERQREADERDPLDDASIEEVLTLAAKASKRWARTLELLKQAEEEERQQQWDDAARAFADPLDEDDHRDRLDRDGDIWGRNLGGCWHTHILRTCRIPNCEWTLAHLDEHYGPLAFAPEPPPDGTGDDLTASEGESGSEDGGDADDAQKAILCPECDDHINTHNVEGCRFILCDCPRTPEDVTLPLIADAVKAERRKLAQELRAKVPSLPTGAHYHLLVLADEWEAGTDG